MAKFSKKVKHHVFDLFMAKYGKKRIFRKDWAPSVFANYIS